MTVDSPKERRNMQVKEFTFTLDMVQSLPFRPFDVVEGDTGNLLHITLLNAGEPLLLNDCWICVAYTSPKGFAFQDEDSGVTVGEQAGTFAVLMDPACYGPGNVSVDVQVYSGPSKKVLITSTRFDFRCVRSLVSQGIVKANMAYPPLLAAAQEALDAAAAAEAALGDLEAALGDKNVQSDWTVTDTSSDAFIRNKPYVPVAPEDVDAAPATHASQHGSTGADPITPAAIGAAALTGGGRVLPGQAYAPALTKTAACTLELADGGQFVYVDAAAAVTVTIPTNDVVAFPLDTEIELCQWGAGAVTVAAATGVTLVSLDSGKTLAGRYACAALKKLAENTWLLAGGIA